MSNQVQVLGIKISTATRDEVIQQIVNSVHSNSRITVSNVNVHAINIAYHDPVFRDFLNNSNIVFCDGFGVKWAVKLLYGKNLERMTPPDWFNLLGKRCRDENISFFLMGTTKPVIEEAALEFVRRNPGVIIKGTHHGYFNKQKNSHDNQIVTAIINDCRPDILVVGFGMPLQEEWIFENRDNIHANVFIPVGAYFDYLTGEVKRAPKWMTDYGLEWLGRLVIEPSRLWKRYIIGNPLFIWRIIKHHVFQIPLPFEKG